jgi:rhodanese-related sulfurtransferase
MFNFFKSTDTGSADLKELVNKGGVILDVRTQQEFSSGHVKGSRNIPLQVLPSGLAELDKNTPVITCCASGNRSATAKEILVANGFTNVHNGGGWFALQQKLG